MISPLPHKAVPRCIYISSIDFISFVLMKNLLILSTLSPGKIASSRSDLTFLGNIY
jgi:hypothetical protein